MCAHVWATVHTWSSDDNFQELFLSCHVSPRDSSHVWLGGKLLYFLGLSHP